MPLLPATSAEYTGYLTVVGGVSLLVAGLGYVLKKAVDIGADLLKTHLLRERPREYTKIYGPDKKVVKRVEVDSR